MAKLMDGTHAPERVGVITERLFRDGAGVLPAEVRASLALRRAWSDVVGETMAKNVVPGVVRPDGTLVVHAVSAAWMQEAQCLKAKILGRLRATVTGGAIRELVVRAERASEDRSAARERREVAPRAAPPAPLSAAARAAIEAAASEVKDPEVKKVVARVLERAARSGRASGRNAP